MRGQPRRPQIDPTAQEAFRIVAGAAADHDPFSVAARAPRTWRQYASAVNRFVDWCEEHALEPIPAKVSTLRDWLVHLVDSGHSVSTVQAYLSGIAVAHKFAGHHIDRRPLTETLRGVRRLAARPRQARPLLGDDLRRILATLDPTKATDARDGALLAIGWAAALRQSEIAGLDFERASLDGDGTGTVSATEEGLAITLTRSKTSQDADAKIAVPVADMPTAVEWFRRWHSVAGLQPGTPAFRQVGRGGRIIEGRLHGPSIGAVVKARFTAMLIADGADEAEAARQAADMRGHSLRAGVMSTMAAAGVPEWKIRARSRHRTANVAAGYIRLAESWHDSGLRGAGF